MILLGMGSNAMETEHGQRTEECLKLLEIRDSDDDDDATCVIKTKEEDIEEDLRYTWDSSSIGSNKNGHTAVVNPLDGAMDSRIMEKKNKGNECFANKDYRGALRCYLEGIELCKEGGKEGLANLLAVLNSNASAASSRLKKTDNAIQYAEEAHRILPEWTKPLSRLAELYMNKGDYVAALDACEKCERLCRASSTGRTEFTALHDTIVVMGSQMGQSDAMFRGRRLEVRSAGEEAWLGKPAPHDPLLDGPLDENTALPSDDLDKVQAPTASSQEGLLTDGTSVRGDALADWNFSNTAVAIQSRRTSFRCVKEAYDAAKDGDKIVLLKGTHNGLGETVSIKKRILIEGEGYLGETVIDQRANVPTFKIERGGVVIRNIDLDQTGFREAILIDGDEHVNPLIENCDLKCSGDDCIHIGGRSKPIVRLCKVNAKKTGIKSFDTSHPTLHGCFIEKCGAQGIEIMDNSVMMATRCSISSCEEDGVVVMGCATGTLVQCKINDNKGPGVDCSDNAVVTLRNCDIHDNVGGCWAWDSSEVHAERCKLSGGPAHVILSGGSGKIHAARCDITGVAHAPEKVWNDGLLHGNNTFHDPDTSVDFPIEAGAFVWEPSPYTSL